MQVLDFYHGSGYVHAAAAAFRHEAMPKGEGAGARSLLASLRDDKAAAQALLEAFEERLASPRRLPDPAREPAEKHHLLPQRRGAAWTIRDMKPPDFPSAAA